MAVVPISRLFPPPPPRTAAYPLSLSRNRLILSPLFRRPPTLSRTNSRRLPHSSAQENGGASEILDEGEVGANGTRAKEQDKEEEEQSTASASVTELKEMMAARKKREEQSDLWAGVAEEIKEIEWPAFGRVLSTTGVVLAVITGSSVALLTVNAVLAEISDRVFIGKGLQDFFG